MVIHNRLHQLILTTSKRWNYRWKKYSFLQVGEIYQFSQLNVGCLYIQRWYVTKVKKCEIHSEKLIKKEKRKQLPVITN